MSVRVVLLARRDGFLGPELRSVKSAVAGIDQIIRLGYEIVGVIDPTRYRDAHQMIADGLADMILIFRFGDLPSVQLVGDAEGQLYRHDSRERRAAPVLRPASEEARWQHPQQAEPVVRAARVARPEPASQQRTQFVDRGQVEPGQGDADRRRPQVIERDGAKVELDERGRAHVRTRRVR